MSSRTSLGDEEGRVRARSKLCLDTRALSIVPYIITRQGQVAVKLAVSIVQSVMLSKVTGCACTV